VARGRVPKLKVSPTSVSTALGALHHQHFPPRQEREMLSKKEKLTKQNKVKHAKLLCHWRSILNRGKKFEAPIGSAMLKRGKAGGGFLFPEP